MKLAYLIIAHNEFEVLRRLVAALDGSDCDFFIHFDKKVKELPAISLKESSLHILSDRVDVRWGTESQILSEYALWEEAAKYGPYDHYVLLSGTHFPLMSRDQVRQFFESKRGVSLFPYMEQANDYQIDMKMCRYNFLPGTFIWKAMLKLQRVLGIERNKREKFYNAGNWACLTEDAVRYLLAGKNNILKKYRWTFCGDEFFGPTELLASPLAGNVEFSKHLLKFEIGRSNARTYTIDDYDELMASGCVFARKFSGECYEVLDKLGIVIG